MGLGGVLAVVVLVALLVSGMYGLAFLTRLGRAAREAHPFLSGHLPSEHAVSRYHARWYPITMIFLAFDMEMVFMYPWTLVVADKGAPAVVEMFVFLAILLAAVTYAWREGALRWT